MKSERQLIQLMWNLYFDSKIQKVQKIPLGLRNSSYYVQSGDGKEFVLKIYCQGYRTHQRVEEAGEIVSKLRELGRPVLEIIRGKNGLYAQTVSVGEVTHICTLSVYVESNFSENEVNKKVVINIAKELKLLHEALRRVERSDIYKLPEVKENIEIALKSESIDKIKEYFQKNRRRKDRMDEFIKFYKEQGAKLLSEYKELDTKKFRLNHGDFNLNNFHIKNGQILKIFDFDELLLAPETFEIALSIYYLDYAEEFYTDELMEIFIKAYYGRDKVTLNKVTEILYFMKYRAYHRMSRYFRHFQFTNKPGGHFTKFVRILKNFNTIDPAQIYKIIKTGAKPKHKK